MHWAESGMEGCGCNHLVANNTKRHFRLLIFVSFQVSLTTILSSKAVRLLIMSDILQMPGAWNSAWEEPSTTTYDVVDAYPTVSPPPSPPPSQSRRASPRSPPPPSQSRRPPPPPRPSQNFHTSPTPPLSESRRVSPPRPSQSHSESFLSPLNSRSESARPPWEGATAPLPPPSRRAPLPTTTQSHSEYPPSFWQNHLRTLRPPSQRRRVPLPTQPGSEYEFFADSSDDGNGDTTEVQKKPIVIAVLGKTGSGKTSFIKAVTGKDLKVGHGLTSCTAAYSNLQDVKQKLTRI